MSLTYKVVETSQVDELSLERILNQTVAEGWTFESFHFAMRESSRRPTMAFVLFTRHGDGDEPEETGR